MAASPGRCRTLAAKAGDSVEFEYTHIADMGARQTYPRRKPRDNRVSDSVGVTRHPLGLLQRAVLEHNWAIRRLHRDIACGAGQAGATSHFGKNEGGNGAGRREREANRTTEDPGGDHSASKNIACRSSLVHANRSGVGIESLTSASTLRWPVIAGEPSRSPQTTRGGGVRNQ